jgi:hypothetical protein
MNDGYMGSGKVILREIKKHGINNFKKDILETFTSAKEMYAWEKEVVTDDFLLREDVYNLRRGGHGGFDYINKNTTSEERSKYGRMGGIICNERGNNKNFDAVSQKKSLDTRRKLGRGFYHDKALQKKGLEKCLTQEAREKRIQSFKDINHQQGKKNSQFGTMWITNDKENKKINRNSIIPLGWKAGRTSLVYRNT